MSPEKKGVCDKKQNKKQKKSIFLEPKQSTTGVASRITGKQKLSGGGSSRVASQI